MVATGCNEKARRCSNHMHFAASKKAPVNSFLSSASLKTIFQGKRNHISLILRSQNARNFGSKSRCFKLAASTASTNLIRWNSANRASHRLLGSMIRVNPVSSKLSFSKQWYIACKKPPKLYKLRTNLSSILLPTSFQHACNFHFSQSVHQLSGTVAAHFSCVPV